jgi:hypothetical protein
MPLREFAGRRGQPTAMVVDGRTAAIGAGVGARAGYDGAKRRKGLIVHAAVTPSVICWPCMLRLLTSKIVIRWKSWPKRGPADHR